MHQKSNKGLIKSVAQDVRDCKPLQTQMSVRVGWAKTPLPSLICGELRVKHRPGLPFLLSHSFAIQLAFARWIGCCIQSEATGNLSELV